MIRWSWGLVIAVLFCIATASLAETSPKPGLMWQRTGLPAVFPLIVKTNPGADYYLTLHAQETGDAKLAAYAVGGDFFKVLVPPGTYFVQIASGENWQGEDALFGAKTEWIDIPDPLTFKVRDHSTKGGHMIDLTNVGQPPIIEVRSLCQRYALARAPRPLPSFDEEEYSGAQLTGPGELLRSPGSYFDPQRLSGNDEPVIPTDFAPYFSNPEFDIRDRLC